jgi:D-3-phosphoglycerate dehydrogenase / 2-oxoglutarate reductase
VATPREKVVIADYDYGDVDIERAIIEKAGFELIAAQCKTEEEEVIEVARDAAAVVAQYATISARVIAELPECRVIARYGTGVDIVDVEAATRHDVLVTNVPNEWCENEVADHAMALLLAVARKVNVYDRATRGGTWQWQSGAPIHRLRGSVLGLLSFGAIARAIAARAGGFGMLITAHDPYLPAEEITAAGVKGVSFDELVTESDCLVIQAPLTAQTHHLFGEAQLRRMKSTAILINTARGPIVDDRALFRALSEGWIAGAGLDDIEEEPAKVRDWRADNPLFGLDNVVITPHAAYYSEEAIGTVRRFAAEEVVRVLTGQPPLSPVNAGELVEARWSRSPGA